MMGIPASHQAKASDLMVEDFCTECKASTPVAYSDWASLVAKVGINPPCLREGAI